MLAIKNLLPLIPAFIALTTAVALDPDTSTHRIHSSPTAPAHYNRGTGTAYYNRGTGTAHYAHQTGNPSHHHSQDDPYADDAGDYNGQDPYSGKKGDGYKNQGSQYDDEEDDGLNVDPGFGLPRGQKTTEGYADPVSLKALAVFLNSIGVSTPPAKGNETTIILTIANKADDPKSAGNGTWSAYAQVFSGDQSPYSKGNGGFDDDDNDVTPGNDTGNPIQPTPTGAMYRPNSTGNPNLGDDGDDDTEDPTESPVVSPLPSGGKFRAL